MQIEKKTLNLEIKSLDASGTFEGLLSVYDVIDEYGDVVERGAYTKTLQENGGRLPLLWQHNQDQPIGELEVRDGEDGLEVKGKLLLDDNVPQARTAYTLLKARIVRGLSIGFRTVKKKNEDKIRRLKEIKLYEGSLVTIPANRFALVSDVKSLGDERKDFNSELEAIDVWSKHYQMLQALARALDRIIYDDGDRETKLEAVAEVIRQFQEAYTGYFPRLMDLWGVKGKPEFDLPSAIPTESRAVFEQYGNKFLELAGKHSGTSGEAAAAAPPTEPEPEALHSEVKSLLESWSERLKSAAA